jgi:hypothetical protein
MQTACESKAILMFDVTEVQGQIRELVELVQVQSIEGVPDSLLGNLDRLSLDVICGECRSAVRADGTIEIVQGFRLGSSFERLRAAILADKRNVAHA